jgi:hypothetical protein
MPSIYVSNFDRQPRLAFLTRSSFSTESVDLCLSQAYPAITEPAGADIGQLQPVAT